MDGRPNPRNKPVGGGGGGEDSKVGGAVLFRG